MSENTAPEFEPPVACIGRVIKGALPENIMIAKDARAALVRAAGIFIFYLTHCSNDLSKENKRNTIFPQDVLNAVKELGFEDFEKTLEDFLEAYKAQSLIKKIKVKSSDKTGALNQGEDEDDVEEDEDEEDDVNEDTMKVVDEENDDENEE